VKRLTNIWRRLRHVALVAVVAAATTASLAGGIASSASASTFNCESRTSEGKTCYQLNGPNETMEEGEGDDYTYPEFELTFWKWNGGSSYTNIYSHVFFSYTGAHCYSSVFTGHENVAAALKKDNLAGYQGGCRA
jgi:hypothetical protein